MIKFAFQQALRSLRHAPAAPLACAAAVAVGAGAATATFAVVYGVLLRPLPFAAPDRLVQFSAATPDRQINFSLPELDDWRTRPTVFTSVAAFAAMPVALTEAGRTSALAGAAVSANFFELLEIPMLAGRPLQPADDSLPVVVISERLWRSRFNADPAIVGSALIVNGDAASIVGVAPAALSLSADDVDVWAPVGWARRTAPPQWGMRGFRGFSIAGRLRPNVTLAAARADVTRVAAELAAEYPRFNRETRVDLTPLPERMTSAVRPMLMLVSVAMALVLAAVCANLITLQLARSVDRQREHGVRLALGASRPHLLMQALAETVVVTAIASTGAIAIAALTLEAVRMTATAALPRLAEVRLDWPAIVFALGASAITLATTAIAPIWRARSAVTSALRQARTGQTRRGRRAHQVLVTMQIATSMALVTGAALLGQSLWTLMSVDAGVVADRAAIVRVSMTAPAFNAAENQTLFLARVLERAAQLPGVRAVGLVSSLPPAGSQMRTTVSSPIKDGGDARDLQVEIVAASAGTFDALGIRVARGRTFNDADMAGPLRTVVLSEAAARDLFPGRDAVGQLLPLGGISGSAVPPTVIGVASDVRFGGLESAPGAALYLPYTQRPFRATHLVVRVDGALDRLSRELPEAIREVDGSVAIGNVRPLADVIAAASSPSRVRLGAITLLAAIALVVAGVGLYGMVAYSVASRSREFAVRLALGSDAGGIVRLVFNSGLSLVLAGVAAGGVLAILFGRIASTMLFGVAPFDVLSLAASAALMTLFGVCACAIPAWRAARITPALVLKTE